MKYAGWLMELEQKNLAILKKRKGKELWTLFEDD